MSNPSEGETTRSKQIIDLPGKLSKSGPRQDNDSNIILESACLGKMKGLMFRLQFCPTAKFPLSKKRIKYWEKIRSLNRESLLFLLSDEPDLKSFLLIPEKNKTLLGKDEKYSWIDVT